MSAAAEARPSDGSHGPRAGSRLRLPMPANGFHGMEFGHGLPAWSPDCDARDLAVQRKPHRFEPAFYPGRLNATSAVEPRKRTAGTGNNYVLTCPTADSFGEWAP